MQPGKLRNRLTIQLRTTITPDSFGADTAAWTDLVTVWGSVEPLSGDEAIAARQVMSDVTHRIRLRFRHGVGPRNRIIWRLYPFTAVAATDVCTVTGRTFQNGDRMRLANTGGTLPAGLVADKNYYARDVSGATFKLAETLGGAAKDITGAGTGTHYADERVFDVSSVLKTDEINRELVLACTETK